MITCNLVGGLGNQLFQIFTTISYAIRIKEKFVFFKTESIILLLEKLDLHLMILFQK